MRICSFNVNSIKARKDLVFQWLDHRQNDIDVLCLQELKLTDEFFPYDEFEKRGFTCQVYGQKAYNGVACCTKLSVKESRKGFGDPSWDEQKRCLEIRLPGLKIINLYAPHGGERGEEKFRYKQDWYAFLMEYLNRHHSPQEALILLGDFNVAHTDSDVYSPEALRDTIGTMPEERTVFENLLGWGLTDIYRHLHPQEKQFTWWGYMGGAIWKDEGMRIDYILATEPVVSGFQQVEVDMWPRKRRKPTPSDHAPLIAALSWDTASAEPKIGA